MRRESDSNQPDSTSSTPSSGRRGINWRVLRLLGVVLLVAFLGWQMNERQQQRNSMDFAKRVRPDRLRIGSLTFTSCAIGSARTVVMKAYCTEFSVPENHAAPDGRRIRLKVAVVKSAAAQANADIVTFLDGGPGGAATEDFPALAAAFEPLLKRHHVLLVDQRGTGGSHQLDCPTLRNQRMEQLTLDLESANEPRFDQALRECLTEITQQSDPAYYATRDAVADLEQLRQALGAPQLNLVGVSYGTRVAQQYAGQYPQAVRSMVLDSVVPNALVLGQDHARNLETALQTQFARCVANTECQQRFGDPYVTLHKLRKRLTNPVNVELLHPYSNEPSQRQLTQERLITLVRLYAYNPASSALLPLVLDEAWQGRYAPLLAQEQMLTTSVSEQLTAGMSLSVSCTEDADLLQTDAADSDTLLGNSLIDYMHKACALWPHHSMPASFHDALTSDIPTLLLAGENDPVTPPHYAQEVTQTLSHARILTAPEQGHAVLAVRCMPELVGQFVENLAPETLNADCLQLLHAPPAFLNYNGAAP